MPATPPTNKGSSTLFSFTPRQVLLSNRTMKDTADNGTLKLKKEQKLLLHQSIAHYLQHSGFSKTLKKFRSEAQIEKDDSEGLSVDLEEMYLKYLETCKDAKATINNEKEQVADVDSKIKGGKSKEKKKKSSKLVSESPTNKIEDNQLELPTVVTENKVKDDLSADAKGDNNGPETEKRSKRKMKKKDMSNSEGGATEKEATHEEKKDSKKRKRSSSEENGKQVTEIKADEETKRRKVDNLNESKGGEQSAKANANLGSDLNSDEENNVVSKTPKEKSNGKANGHLDNGTEKSSVQRSQNKQHKGSVEQKPVKAAFQRVQVDKVEFVDERLQDNSYWAKDGAEIGYGAKAEEVLGQVRGRDFRHEKTKKKRGTYRGGQIDLDSHSVKFNYSDED